MPKTVLVSGANRGIGFETAKELARTGFRVFTDADHVKTEWVLYKGGKPDSTHSFKLVRMHK